MRRVMTLCMSIKRSISFSSLGREYSNSHTLSIMFGIHTQRDVGTARIVRQWLETYFRVEKHGTGGRAQLGS